MPARNLLPRARERNTATAFWRNGAERGEEQRPIWGSIPRRLPLKAWPGRQAEVNPTRRRISLADRGPRPCPGWVVCRTFSDFSEILKGFRPDFRRGLGAALGWRPACFNLLETRRADFEIWASLAVSGTPDASPFQGIFVCKLTLGGIGALHQRGMIRRRVP